MIPTLPDGHDRVPDHVKSLLARYYPQDVESSMGPTALIPGSHLVEAAADRNASHGNFRDQVVATLGAGSVLVLHYDIWHAGTANTSNTVRYMVKYLFERVSESKEPTWNHDLEGDKKARDWNLKGESKNAVDILTFSNPLSVAQSDHYKDRTIRRKCWDLLLGEPADEV